jgi:hypothetical protein
MSAPVIPAPQWTKLIVHNNHSASGISDVEVVEGFKGLDWNTWWNGTGILAGPLGAAGGDTNTFKFVRQGWQVSIKVRWNLVTDIYDALGHYVSTTTVAHVSTIAAGATESTPVTLTSGATPAYTNVNAQIQGIDCPWLGP